MFTGIVLAVGDVRARAETGVDGDVRLSIASGALGPLGLGDSVCVSGVCLTVTARDDEGFDADVSRETLRCTTLGDLRAGARVNLEPALTPTSALGGHLVSGHVDATGSLLDCAREARSTRMRFVAPATLARYLAPKGSVCVDGVSLTVNAAVGAEFEVNLIPHTLEATTLGALVPGARVNLEVDLVARYLERLLGARDAESS